MAKTNKSEKDNTSTEETQTEATEVSQESAVDEATSVAEESTQDIECPPPADYPVEVSSSPLIVEGYGYVDRSFRQNLNK